MGIPQQILDKAASLPPEKQRELLDFADRLQKEVRGATGRPWQGLAGALAHRRIDLSEGEIEDARREMWGDFPRDIP
jgi:hypothetical protein